MKRKYQIEPSKLYGTVELSGAKNSALRLLAGTILTDESIVINNFPSNLIDIKIHLDMLKILGKSIHLTKDRVNILKEKECVLELRWEGQSIRNTLLILGCLVSRFKYGCVPLPGGCSLGERKHDLHVMVLEKLGAKVYEKNGYIFAESKSKLVGTDIHLPIRSTGATENAILSSVLALGKTMIWNPHIRPEIIDLVKFLNRMGANITVQGQESITVEGVDGLSGVEYTVIPDNMEAITWLIGSTITNGEIEINQFPFEHLEVPLIFLKESGSRFYRFENSVIVKGGKCYPVEISTGPYPGINSDMQPLFAVFGSCARGNSKIVDLRFTKRFGYVNELNKLGIKTEIKDNILNIYGGNRIIGNTVNAIDLRAGISLVLAGMIAEGVTTIENIWQIERGYNSFVEKLQSLEGNIKILND